MVDPITLAAAGAFIAGLIKGVIETGIKIGTLAVAVFSLIISLFKVGTDFARVVIVAYLDFKHAQPVLNAIILFVIFVCIAYLDIAVVYAQPGLLPTFGAEAYDISGILNESDSTTITREEAMGVPVGFSSSFFLANITIMNGTYWLDAKCLEETQSAYIDYLSNYFNHFVWEIRAPPHRELLGEPVLFEQFNSPEDAAEAYHITQSPACPWMGADTNMTTYDPAGPSQTGLNPAQLEELRLNVLYDNFAEDFCNDTKLMENSTAGDNDCWLIVNASNNQRMSRERFEELSFVAHTSLEYEQGGIAYTFGGVHEGISGIFKVVIVAAKSVPDFGETLGYYVELFYGLYLALIAIARMALYGLYMGLMLDIGWCLMIAFIFKGQPTM